MGTVLDLRPRPFVSGDWTAAERDQLWALAQRLPVNAAGAEMVFGRTDAGDPWFVIKDVHEEVLLHVARIRGVFVVHSTSEDIVEEGPDLGSALARSSGVGDDNQRKSNVVSLQGEVLPTHSVLVIGAAGLHQTPAELSVSVEQRQDYDPASDAPDAPPSAPPEPGLPAELHETWSPTVVDEPERVVVVASAYDQRPSVEANVDAWSAYADESRQAQALVELQARAAGASTAGLPALREGAERDVVTLKDALPSHASAGGETVMGAAGPDTLHGGAGDDVLDGHGAGRGEIDVLDGRGGADRLVLGPDVVAIGGPGTDAFVVTSPAHGGGTPRPLGIVVDFFGSKDDHLEFAPGAKVTVMAVSPEADVLASVRGLPGMQNAPVTPGARVALDLDGDGHEDGYVLLGGSGASQNRSAVVAPNEASARNTGSMQTTFAFHEAQPGTFGPVSTGGGAHAYAETLSAFQLDPSLFSGTGPAHVLSTEASGFPFSAETPVWQHGAPPLEDPHLAYPDYAF